MARERILVVEDEEDIQELISYNLKKDGYVVDVVGSGEDAMVAIEKQLPALILLDLMLPDMSGLEVCKLVRSNPRLAHIPIIMVTARSEESDLVVGLELGADDYVNKPFSPKVLAARVRACLRRKRSETPVTESLISIGDITIDPIKHSVSIAGKRIDLTATEFGVLHFLARKPGWVFSRQQIVDSVKGEDYAVTDRSVDVQMVGLRRKLGPCADYIETIRGVGYRFKEV